MKKREKDQKITNLSVRVRFEAGQKISKASVNESGDFVFIGEFGEEITPISISREMYHDRPKGPKIRSKQVLQSGQGAVSGFSQLTKYDAIFAIDTNTAEVDGNPVSVTGFCPFRLTQNEDGFVVQNLEDSVQIYEFEGKVDNPEMMAISMLVSDLTKCSTVDESQAIAIITDTKLDSIDLFNERSKPIYLDCFLPEGFTLIYASTDTGNEILNKFIRICDKAAELTIRERRAGDAPEVPFQPIVEFPSVKVRVGRRNDKITIENPIVSDFGIEAAEEVAMFGLKKV